MPARKRRAIQRAVENEVDETERDLGRNDGQRVWRNYIIHWKKMD